MKREVKTPYPVVPFCSFDFSRGTFRRGTDVYPLSPLSEADFLWASVAWFVADGSSRIFLFNGVSWQSRSPKHLLGTLQPEVHEDVGA